MSWDLVTPTLLELYHLIRMDSRMEALADQVYTSQDTEDYQAAVY